MSISFGSISSRGAASFTVTAGSQPLLIAYSQLSQGGLSFGSQSMTLLGQASQGADLGAIWYLPNPVTGTSENFAGGINWCASYYGAIGMQAFQSSAGIGDGSPRSIVLNNNFGGHIGNDIWGVTMGFDGDGNAITITPPSGWVKQASFTGGGGGGGTNSQFWYDSEAPLVSGFNTIDYTTVNGSPYVYVAGFITPYEPPATTTPGSFLLNMI